MERRKAELVWWLLSEARALLAEESLDSDDDRELAEVKRLLQRLDVPPFQPVVARPWTVVDGPLFAMLDQRFGAVMSMLQQVSTGVAQSFRIEHSAKECLKHGIGAVKGVIENGQIKLMCDGTEGWTVDRALK